HQLAVPGREDLVRRHHWKGRSLPPRHRAVREVTRQVVTDVPERRLVERDVDGCALAGTFALEQRCEDADRRPRAGPLVDQRGADAPARPARLTRHRDETAGGLHQRVVPRLVREGPDAAICADVAVDEAWIARAHIVGTETELLGKTGSQALQE